MKHDCVVFQGFELIGHITKTLYADEISCELRCLQDKNCQSYNSKSDVNDAKKECQLSNQTKERVMCARCCLAFRRVNCCFLFF